jgi:outer membrane protein TolC
VLAAASAGCNRAYYRREADCEAIGLIHQKSRDPRWRLDHYHVEPDPRSRMFSPHNPDCPPMPPDDPAAHRLMHCVDCKKGWPGWSEYGFTPRVESPDWRRYLPRNEEGQVVLDRQAAVQLALLHSRQYQEELEDLYLAALDVSFERFRFDSQFFGNVGSGPSTQRTQFTANGPDRSGVGGDSSSTLEVDQGLQWRRLTATGGQLMAGVANSLVWQFSGPDQYSATTLLDFSIVQPLLRAGGRAVVLESLTVSERALLANIRQMERFRRGFYLQVVAGLSSGPGPSRSGPTIGGLATGGGSSASGILRIMEEQLRIRNQRDNVDALRDSLAQLDAAYEAGRIDRFQVDLARQALYNAQSRLLALKTSYQDRLDSYKITLGLPPSLELVIDDPLLLRFNLIDSRLSDTREDVANLLVRLREPAAEQAEGAAQFPQLMADLLARCRIHIQQVGEDLQALDEALPERRRRLAQLAEFDAVQRGEVDPRAYSTAALERRVSQLHGDYEKLVARLQTTVDALSRYATRDGKAALDVPGQPGKAEPGAQPVPEELRNLVTRLSAELLELSLVQAGARLDAVNLVPIELQSPRALEIARRLRLDWMNARAALVDIWRQIEVSANDLKSDLDVRFSGDMGTLGNNPVAFRGTTGQLRVGLEFDAPLTRLAERNDYREALINYQQARRAYYAFEDRVDQQLRTTLRTIRLNQIDFELRRAAARVAISQVDLTQLRLQRPPRPGEESTFGATTARDLVSALSGLLGAQNDFLAVWVDYEVQRMNLDFQLGTMQLDDQGMWVDPGAMVWDSDDGEAAGLDAPDRNGSPEPLRLQQVAPGEAPNLIDALLDEPPPPPEAAAPEPIAPPEPEPIIPPDPGAILEPDPAAEPDGLAIPEPDLQPEPRPAVP